MRCLWDKTVFLEHNFLWLLQEASVRGRASINRDLATWAVLLPKTIDVCVSIWIFLFWHHLSPFKPFVAPLFKFGMIFVHQVCKVISLVFYFANCSSMDVAASKMDPSSAVSSSCCCCCCRICLRRSMSSLRSVTSCRFLPLCTCLYLPWPGHSYFQEDRVWSLYVQRNASMLFLIDFAIPVRFGAIFF